MNKKGKLVLFLCVSIPAFYLVRKLLIVSGLAIVGEVATYLFLGVVGLILVNILVPKEYRTWANLLPILCTLIFLVMGIGDWYQSYKENKEAEREKIRGEYFKAVTESLPVETKKEIIRELLGFQKQEATVKRPSAKPQEKSSSEKPRNSVKILPPEQEKPSKSTWGGLIATSTYPEVVNSWSRFAQTEAQKAMQRVANQGKGDRVKIE